MPKKFFAWEDSHFPQLFPGCVFESALTCQFKKTSTSTSSTSTSRNFDTFFLLVIWLWFLVLGWKTKLFKPKINGASLITLRLVLFFGQKFTHEHVMSLLQQMLWCCFFEVKLAISPFFNLWLLGKTCFWNHLPPLRLKPCACVCPSSWLQWEFKEDHILMKKKHQSNHWLQTSKKFVPPSYSGPL